MKVWCVQEFSKKRQPGRRVYVRAATRDGAECTGKFWLRVLGRKPYSVQAWEYEPQRDLEIRRFVRAV